MIKNNFWTGTLSEYEALKTHNNNTTYIITDDSEVIDIIKDTEISESSTWSSNKIINLFNNVLPAKPEKDNYTLKSINNTLVWIKDLEIKETDLELYDLTLGASGSTYFIPKDGYIVLNKYCTTSGQNIEIYSKRFNMVIHKCVSVKAHSLYSVYVKVNKEDEITINYSFAGETKNFLYFHVDE